MTPVWITGFEHGLTTPVINGGGLCDVIVGSVTVQGTTKRTGDYALKVNPSAATAFIVKTISGTYLVGRAYVYFETLPTSDNAGVLAAVTVASQAFQINYSSTSGKLHAICQGGSAAAGPVVTTGKWYRIDYKMYCGASSTIEWQVNGVDQTTATSTITASTWYRTQIGTTLSTTATLYYDDIVLSSTSGDYPIGPGGVVGLRPYADGTHYNAAGMMEDTDFNLIDGSTYHAYDKLKEKPWGTSATTDLVRCAANTGGDNYYCEVTFDQTEKTSIWGVWAVLQYASATTTANLAAAAVYDSADQKSVIFGDPTGTRADYSWTTPYYAGAIVTAPVAGWSMAYVNSLKARIGFCTDGNPDPFWLALILEVAYTEADSEAHSGAALLHGNGTIAPAVQKGGKGAALTSGGGALAAFAMVGMLGLAAISGGPGHLIASGQKNASSISAISGGGSLVATGYKGTAPEEHSGAASISGAGSLTPLGKKASSTSASISGAGSLIGAGRKAGMGLGAMAAGGSITASGAAVEFHSGAAALSGNGSLSGTGLKGGASAAVISGAGAQTSSGMKTGASAGTISAGGSLTATGSKGGAEEHSGSALISGKGELSATGWAFFSIEEIYLLSRVVPEVEELSQLAVEVILISRIDQEQ